jgi:hypothetical protein
MGNGIGQWFKCKGCGQPIGFLPAGVAGPRKTCAHVKPDHLIGVPNSVPCALYRRLDADELWELHQDAEPIESPTEFKPVLG